MEGRREENSCHSGDNKTVSSKITSASATNRIMFLLLQTALRCLFIPALSVIKQGLSDGALLLQSNYPNNSK